VEVKDVLELTNKRWEGIRPLKKGGQGEVFLVRTAEARKARTAALTAIQQAVSRVRGTIDPNPAATAEALASALKTYNAEEPSSSFAAAKFFLLRDHSTMAQITARFKLEVEALGRIRHPGILRLLDADAAQLWMVTEFHANGDLTGHRERFTGRAVESLRAIRPLVAAVAELHGAGYVHRDIKPANIFVAADDRLVLGDFGIVFIEERPNGRPTELLERVGPRDWMAPFANTGERIEEVRPSFDVYMLAKVLWWLVSGKMTPYWYHDRDSLNIAKLFPQEPGMAAINRVLDRSMVEDETNCLSSAKELLVAVDEALSIVERGKQRLHPDMPRPCRVCGRGQYRPVPPSEQGRSGVRLLSVSEQEFELALMQPHNLHGTQKGQALSVRVFACEACGHVEMFRWPDGYPLAAWETSPF
jgi:serine/threonine protein kinase